MKLQNAIKELINQFGDNVVSETRLANLLADLNGYEEYPAIKQIFKDFVKDGYGSKIFNSYKHDVKTIFDKSLIFAKEFAKETNYKEDLISYCFDSILYGLGCLTSVNEPLSKGFDPYSKGEIDVLDNLDEQLKIYQKQYLDLLDKLIITSDDVLHKVSGYYSTESLNKLYFVEAKIYALQQELNKNDFSWCKEKREQKIAYYKNKASFSLEKILDELKREYLNILSSEIVIPKLLLIKRSGLYKNDSINKMALVEKDIKNAYNNLNRPYDFWCQKERDKILAKYKVDTGKFVFGLICKIVLPFVFFMLILGTGISYYSSLDAINVFERNIQLGEQSASNGDFNKALETFISARNNYSASFLPSHYKSIANEHINSNIDKIVSQCNTLIEQKHISEAETLLNTLPENIVIENKTNMEKIKSAKISLKIAVDNGLDNIIMNISKNKGNLDDDSKYLLNELLKINPNDYWLNFIKNKEK